MLREPRPAPENCSLLLASAAARVFVCHMSGLSVGSQYAGHNIGQSGQAPQACVFFLGISALRYNWFPRALGAQVPFENMRLCLSFLICEMEVRALHLAPVCNCIKDIKCYRNKGQ